MPPALGKSLILVGLFFVIVGLFIAYGPKISWLGRLPGDIYIKKDNFTFYFPLATSILVSVVLSLIFRFLGKK